MRPCRTLPLAVLAVLAALLAPLLVAPSVAAAEAATAAPLLDRFEEKVTEHVLDNGWTFLIVERPVAPVFSFATVADVGGAQEVLGITGLAHMFEHMAFKGTPKLGTTDWAAEREALAAVEAAYQAYEALRHDPRADPAAVEALLLAFRDAQAEAAQFVVANEFGEVIDRAGGVGLNASTTKDITTYSYALPANKLELFAYLESERFLHPVFREFYKERDVVQEERRMRTENQPIGRLIEQTVATAFQAHAYHHPNVGYMSDLESFTATDAEAFFRIHYVPSNLVTAIVGDVDAATLIPLLERYFGRIPAGPDPPELRTVEPPQIAEKEVVLVDPSQPIYLEAYHKPSALHPDQAVYQAIDDVLSNGRTSRLYRRLVRDEQTAAFAGSFSDLPGGKYPSLWVAFAVPSRGEANEAVQATIREELARLREEPISDAELERFVTRAKADLLRGLRSNAGLAMQLAVAETLHGDWREIFHRVEAIEAVTADDVMRVARATFVPRNRTVAMIVTEEPAEAGEADETADDTAPGEP